MDPWKAWLRWLASPRRESMFGVLMLKTRQRDMDAVGPGQARLAAVARLANCLVAAVALAVVLAGMAPAVALDVEPLRHWPSGQRDLVVVDKTGDAGWQAATRHAVAIWDQSRSGADIRLTWTTGSGPCEDDDERIVVCGAPSEDLEGVFPFQGLAGQETEDRHARSALVEVCADCGLSEVIRRVVATHEVGHALGLVHTRRLGSIMFPTGGTDQPDPGDYATLRDLYGHTD